jgi:ankyrin repeat protein
MKHIDVNDESGLTPYVDPFLMENIDDDEPELTTYDTPLCSKAKSKFRWKDLPYRLKRFYLYREFQAHHDNQCMWSSLVKGILDLPNHRTTGETYTLIHQLIDAYLCGKFSDLVEPFNPERHLAKNRINHYFYREISYPSEPLHETVRYALATSAILRGDCIQLQAILNQGLRIQGKSDRLALVPMDIAAKKGSREIINLIIRLGCMRQYHDVWDPPWSFAYIMVIDTMVESGNDGGLAEWMDYLVREGEMNPKVLKRAMIRAAVLGNISTMELVQEKCESLYGSPGWISDVLEEAICHGSLDAIKFLFRRCGVDTNTRKTPTDRMPLSKAMKAMYKFAVRNRPNIVKFFLENGADPNGNDPPKKRTPLEVAVSRRDFESAKILLKHGATVNIKKFLPLLRRYSYTGEFLLELLWPELGSYRTYKSGRKSYTLCRDARAIKNIENAFLDLGWSERDVEDARIDHFIDVY